MSSEDLSVLLKLGNHYLNKVKDLNRAEQIYNECIAKYPNDFRAYFVSIIAMLFILMNAVGTIYVKRVSHMLIHEHYYCINPRLG